MEFTLNDLETAINHWRDRYPSDDGMTVCRQARILVEPYTLMFLEKRERVAVSELTADQVDAVRGALAALR
ncbi:DUF3717 domain-containing protein [Burkholderia cenocepacia]|uniref:DUF3717 domain-containing protein n=1 Tax=Burkholderia cenocepacia TaxID=95486 RepID=UPI001AA13DA1|nr:DUF3717 domain-containing protein [Burkholderia cenocepacia]MBO1859271.1 DUF3717 domain-containing protein [Burkholderia cenocepacia]